MHACTYMHTHIHRWSAFVRLRIQPFFWALKCHMCMYICIYIYIYIYIYIIFKHNRSFESGGALIHACVYIHTYIHTYTHTYMHALYLSDSDHNPSFEPYVYVSMHVCVYIYILYSSIIVPLSSQVLSYMHVCTYIHTYMDALYVSDSDYNPSFEPSVVHIYECMYIYVYII